MSQALTNELLKLAKRVQALETEVAGMREALNSVVHEIPYLQRKRGRKPNGDQTTTHHG